MFSFVKLIPKKEDSSTAKDFRPISLINSFYKIVFKVLAERLKIVMPKLVSHSQGETNFGWYINCELNAFIVN